MKHFEITCTYMCPFIYAHAHAHTLILGIIAGGAGVSWKREGGEIQTRHTEKPNDLYIFLQKKKKLEQILKILH